MKIGLDFDGVISDCGKLKSDTAKKIYNLNIPPEKFKKEIVIGEGYLTDEEYRELQSIIYGTQAVGLLMEPVAGMLDLIPKLVDSGHSIIVVTSRGEVELGIAKEWSSQKGLNLDFIGLGPGMSKAGACEELDIYIDDDIEKLEPLVDIVPHRFLFSWGYNLHIDEGHIARRVESWAEFYEVIQHLP